MKSNSASSRPRNRGVAQIVVVVFLAAATIAALVPSWHLPAFLQPKPPTAQLQAKEQELATAKAAQAQAEAQQRQAEARLAAAQAQEQQRKDEQLRYAQQMAAGAADALAQVPAEHQTTEVLIAAQMVGRVENGLGAALGRLPPAQADEIRKIVEEARSADKAEIEASHAALQAKDDELATATEARVSLEKQIPVLQATASTKAAEAQAKTAEALAKDAEVQVATAKVSTYAEKMAAAEAEAGSFGAYLKDAVAVVLIFILCWFLKDLALPSLAQEFPKSRILGGLYRTVTSLTSAHAITTNPPRT